MRDEFDYSHQKSVTSMVGSIPEDPLAAARLRDEKTNRIAMETYARRESANGRYWCDWENEDHTEFCYSYAKARTPREDKHYCPLHGGPTT